MKGPIPIFVCHYTPEKARRFYVESEFQKQLERASFALQFITEHDKEEPHVQASYAHANDEKLVRETLDVIRSLVIGYSNALLLNFYEIVPPKTRTTCGAILAKSFAQRLIKLNPPICLGIDWLMTWAFVQLNTKVYWVEPTVFKHGSQTGAYVSTREYL